MKKILMTIFLFFIFYKVDASLYTYSAWSDKYPSFIEYKEIIQQEERFLWYKEAKINKEYLPISKLDGKIVDYNDYKIINQEEESIKKLEELENKEIVKKTKNYTFKSKKIIKISIDFSNVKSKFDIQSIELFDNSNNKIEFKINKKDSVNIDIDLKEEFDAESINMLINYNIENPDYDKVFINMCNADGYCIFYSDITLNTCIDKCKLNINRFNIKDNLTLPVDFYSYVEKLYATYDKKKVYEPTYHSKLDGYIKDETTKKMFYRYITSEKVYLNSDLQIVYDMKECYGKRMCHIIKIKQPKLENPDTGDRIYTKIIFAFLSIILIIIVLKKSSFVEFNKS